MSQGAGYWAAKRAFDLAGALLLAPVVLCVAAVLMAMNPWFNPGPLLFRQARVGQGDRLFLVVKFRTMRAAPPAPRFADAEQHRITRLGGHLRRCRFDELPQIINILRGEMSLIGPRPEQPEFVQRYAKDLPGYLRRHSLRPGISGLSQVMQGYTSDTDGAAQKLALDLRYIDQASPRLDAFITWRTLVTVITGFGAL